MVSFLLSLLTRFSFTQVVGLVAATSLVTVTVAGSADVVSMVEALARSVSASTGEVDQKPALAVLASQVQIDPNYVMKSVTYRLADVPTSIAAIVFRLEAPEVARRASSSRPRTPRARTTRARSRLLDPIWQ